MENIIKRASEIIFSNEGGYSSVNRDDNGAVSVGRLQWHGTRALNLLKKIVKALGEEGSLAFISEELHKDIMSSRSWSRRTADSLEAASLSAMLSSEESKATQDVQVEADVSSYLEHIESLGVSEESALIFMADIENQGGAGASERIISAADGKDIDSLYRAASTDRVFKNYMSRRARVYRKLTGHPFGEETYEGEMYEVRYGDTLSGIAAEYGTCVRDIAEENGIVNPSFIRVGDLLRIPMAKREEDTAPSPDISHTYTVVRGDTLSGIGGKVGVAWREIALLNGIVEPYTIHAGQVLKLPSAEKTSDEPVCTVRTHTVARGDTLSALARRYNTTVQAMVRANREKYRAIDSDYIVVGWELLIPEEAV